MNRLLFRRQFLLTNKQINFLQNWRIIKLSKLNVDFYLHLHPDLEYNHVVIGDNELFLLGFVLDPYQPERSNSDIVKELAEFSDYDSMLKRTDTLSGRFAIVFNNAMTVKLCNDATSFREVFFYNDQQIIACGSTSKIIADCFDIPRDEDKNIKTFFDSEIFNRVGRRWVGTRTVFENIFRLQPNHYLDLLMNKTYRFWPRERRKEISLAEAAPTIAGILTGTYDAAVRRYSLHQSLTGGWDTRLMLAASRNYLDSIRLYFIRGMKSDTNLGNSPDYRISHSIAAKYKLPIETILIESESVDPDFKETFYCNNILARPAFLPIFFDASKKNLDNTVNVAGSGSNETLRLLNTIHRDISDGKAIAREMGYSSYSYAIDAINEWLKESIALRDMDYNFIDMFNWEQHFGNWGSLSGAEQDIVREEMRPFNNRTLIATYQALPDRYRYKDYPLGHIAVIKLLWEDLLSFEVDMKLPKFKNMLRYLGLEQTADKVLQHVKTIM